LTIDLKSYKIWQYWSRQTIVNSGHVLSIYLLYRDDSRLLFWKITHKANRKPAVNTTMAGRRSLEIMQFGFRVRNYNFTHSFLSRENKWARLKIMNLCWFISKPVSMSTKLNTFVWPFISSLKWYLTMKVDLYPATLLAHLKK